MYNDNVFLKHSSFTRGMVKTTFFSDVVKAAKPSKSEEASIIGDRLSKDRFMLAFARKAAILDPYRTEMFCKYSSSPKFSCVKIGAESNSITVRLSWGNISKQ